MTPARRGQWQTAAEVLTQVSRRPGITRAAVARELRLSTSSATEVTAKLRDVRLLAEAPAPSQGRGRPTTLLRAHPQGPVALALDLRQSNWRSAVVALDGTFLSQTDRRHRTRRAEVVLDHLHRAVREAQEQYGERLQAVGLAVPGTLRDNRLLLQASAPEWFEMDLEIVTVGTGVSLLAGNDATLSGVAEARTGAAVGAGTALHLIIEAGIGGTLLIDGVPVLGASGAAGEFGHTPFGDRSRQCLCGARGCWNLEIDGRALAHHLHDPDPDDPHAYTEAILQRTDPTARRAVERVATAIAAGIAGLVNSHDPDVVTLGGLAVPLRAAAPEAFEATYLEGLMTFRRPTPPPIRTAAHQADGPLRGAAALALDHLTSEQAVATWAAAQ
ncbi:ROK family protein [Kribbella sandramycini]|uniref:Putative NBD/HSP70 family sugar kinase n=1 Tax=Kribbella sandramycini TaxID=60450 RepID=A0A7Y4P122_9ACTN|nr:ROK family transcriptional regulator [Kribbella sandramycini]MBB6570643.1 putative NBD/HSP70 family sugar kinase [Kribbella sandramycini]NOL43787.1 ROK family protein [Kribbella sandramycini]